jgi:hypothetical protein
VLMPQDRKKVNHPEQARRSLASMQGPKSWQASHSGAGEGNRTLVCSLGSSCFACSTEFHQFSIDTLSLNNSV